jgi:hypothetical protein
MTSPRANALERLYSALGITGNEMVVASIEALLCRTRRELYECARQLGLTRLSRLRKEALASRVFAALNRGSPADHQPAPAMDHVEPEHIPWGYGADRVTAMVVDPERLYVYWEVTDDAIERARGALGPGGPDAWLCLRVYDVTGRIFDGTNAHSYFDHAVSRDDRQWFFFIGKPASTAIVELGLRSHEGFFVRVARSGRADFPRRDPVSPGGVEWLTVSAATGDVHNLAHQGVFDAGAPAVTGLGFEHYNAREFEHFGTTNLTKAATTARSSRPSARGTRGRSRRPPMDAVSTASSASARVISSAS